jgi:hypothetical protein
MTDTVYVVPYFPACAITSLFRPFSLPRGARLILYLSSTYTCPKVRSKYCTGTVQVYRYRVESRSTNSFSFQRLNHGRSQALGRARTRADSVLLGTVLVVHVRT